MVVGKDSTSLFIVILLHQRNSLLTLTSTSTFINTHKSLTLTRRKYRQLPPSMPSIPNLALRGLEVQYPGYLPLPPTNITDNDNN